MNILERIVPHFSRYDEVFRRIGPSGYTVALNIVNITPEMYYTTLPDEWVREYIQHRYAVLDPVMQFALYSHGSKRWDEIMSMKIPFLSKMVYDRACHFDLKFGGCVVRKSTEGKNKKNLLSFGRADARVTDSEMTEAEEAFDELIMELQPDYGLSERQIKILSLAASGLTRARISEEVCTSQETVRDEMKRIRTLLGNAENITEAVSIGIELRIIKSSGGHNW